MKMNAKQSIFVQNNVCNIMKAIANKVMKIIKIDDCDVIEVFNVAIQIINNPYVHSCEHVEKTRKELTRVFYDGLDDRVLYISDLLEYCITSNYGDDLPFYLDIVISNWACLSGMQKLSKNKNMFKIFDNLDRLQHLSQYIEQYEQCNNPLLFTRIILSQEKEKTSYILTLLHHMFSDCDEYETIKRYAIEHIKQ